MEEQEARRRAAHSKGLIAWTDPEGAVEEKKEFVWSPQRIEDEAGVALQANTATSGYFNTADLFHWMRHKLCRPYLPMALLDPIWFREETIKRMHQSLVRSQMFQKERLQMLGPDLAAAHFLCHNNCRVRFRGHTHWTELGPKNTIDIPAIYVPGTV